MIGIIGTGRMALEHFKVLNYLNKEVIFFGRTGESSTNISKITSKPVITNNYLDSTELKRLDQVIVATPIETLLPITLELAKLNIEAILVEKPLVTKVTDFDLLRDLPNRKNIYVGFNRRFYQSVKDSIRICNDDGGVRSCTFSFDENIRNWAHPYNSLKTIEGRNPIISQSSHLIDLVFYLIGLPRFIEFKSSKPTNVTNDQIMYGFGESVRNIPFVFMSDWSAPGNWKIELNTLNYKLVLSPLERLNITKFVNSKSEYNQNQWIKTNENYVTDELEINFKPGIFQQNFAFIKREYGNLLCLDEYEKEFFFMEKMQSAFKN